MHEECRISKVFKPNTQSATEATESQEQNKKWSQAESISHTPSPPKQCRWRLHRRRITTDSTPQFFPQSIHQASPVGTQLVSLCAATMRCTCPQRCASGGLPLDSNNANVASAYIPQQRQHEECSRSPKHKATQCVSNTAQQVVPTRHNKPNIYNKHEDIIESGQSQSSTRQ